MRVLIIDDAPMAQLLIRETLSPNDFEVIEAENGEAGIQLAVERLPNLVLLDILMSSMDGFACLKGLRDRLERAIMIYLTSDGRFCTLSPRNKPSSIYPAMSCLTQKYGKPRGQ